MKWSLHACGGVQGGARLRSRGFNAAVIAAGILFPVTNAFALWNDKLEVFVAERITHDSNVFRIAGASDPATAIGSSSKGDTYITRELGFRFDVPVSRQRFLGEWGWNNNRYDRFTVLNFTGNRGNAVWQWQAGNDLSGQLGYARSRSLASLSNVQSGVQSSTPNPIEKQNAFFNIDYLLTPRWRLKGELTNSTNSNTIPEFQVNDVDVNGTGLTVSFVTPADNEVGLSIRAAGVSYPYPQLVAGNLVDNAYRQRNVALVTGWTISGRSHLSALLGRVKRSYDQLPQRDFEDTTFHAAYEWKATGKLTLTADTQRDISATEEVTTGFVFVQSVALRPAFNLSEKINIGGALEFVDRDYLGDPGLVAGTVQPRSDRVRSTALTVTYRPIRRAWLEAGMRRETRSSTAALGDYEVNIIGVSARIGF